MKVYRSEEFCGIPILLVSLRISPRVPINVIPPFLVGALTSNDQHLHPMQELWITSVTQKNVPSTVVIHNYAWYVFLRDIDRRYLEVTCIHSFDCTCFYANK